MKQLLLEPVYNSVIEFTNAIASKKSIPTLQQVLSRLWSYFESLRYMHKCGVPRTVIMIAAFVFWNLDEMCRE